MVQHLEHLLFYGADMNAHNASGNTPLHVCAVNNQVRSFLVSRDEEILIYYFYFFLSLDALPC